MTLYSELITKMFKLRRTRRVKNTIANNASLCPLTIIKILWIFSLRRASNLVLLGLGYAQAMPTFYLYVSALQSRFDIYTHLLISEESNLAAFAKHRDTRFINLVYYT